jgi:hypothetical protein
MMTLRLSPDLFHVAPSSNRSPNYSPRNEGADLLMKKTSFGLPVLYKIGEISNYRKLVSKDNVNGSKMGTYKKHSDLTIEVYNKTSNKKLHFPN